MSLKNINGALICLMLSACGKGDPGVSGLTISSGFNCTKVDTGLGSALGVRYESILYSTSDRFVNCYIGGSAASFTNSQIYKSGQNGATTGSCLIGVDVDTATSGFWVFTSQSGTTKAVYNDVGSANNGYTVTFAASDCTAF